MAISNQPVCQQCWGKENPKRIPVITKQGPETCYMCGRTTLAGIYVRRDESKVPYPTKGEN